jgi:hypothetical protein
MSNLDNLFGLLGPAARERIFQALCTERDRLDALGPAAESAASLTSVLTEVYASNLVADQCCGQLRTTHAECPVTA